MILNLTGLNGGSCGLKWGGIGSHPPCLDLPREERRALMAEVMERLLVEDLPETSS